MLDEDSHPDDFAQRTPSASEGAASDDLGRVRDLLLGPDWERVVELRERIDDPTRHAQDVSRVLPAAIAIRSSLDDELGAALAPTVEESLRASVRKNPQAIVDAIFPVMGPAIRRAVADTFLRAIQGLNEAIESSFSWQGIKWRFEALRTGKPYAEVVLLHKLVYRVEQVFLIHRETGLLLQHLQADSVAAQDADMVSGMLTAIQDFVKDSFKVEGGDALNSMRVGSLTVWIAHSPHAVLAAVVRGIARQDFLSLLSQALEAVSARMGPALSHFEGDASVFAACRPDLEPLLVEARRDPPRGRKRTFLGWLVVGVILGLLAWWWATTFIRNREWDKFLSMLDGEPGIIVTRTQKHAGVFSLHGLRDPLASDPGALLARTGLDPKQVEMHWDAYQAVTAAFVMPRAAAILQPPPGVEVVYEQNTGTLHVFGKPLHRWIIEARTRSGLVPGVLAYDDSKLEDVTVTELNSVKKSVERHRPQFVINTTDLAPGQDRMFHDMVRDVQSLVQLAERGGVSLRIELVGHTDSSGAEAKNMRLSKQRADAVAGVLQSAGVAPDWLTPLGVGATDPTVDEKSEGDKLSNRCVSLRVVVDPRR